VKNVALTIAFLIFISQAVIYFGQIGSKEFFAFFSNFGAISSAFFATIGLLDANFSSVRKHKLNMVWLFLGLGFGLYLGGELVWAISQIGYGIEVPYPSMADAFWLAGYAPIFVGLTIAILGYSRNFIKQDKLILGFSWLFFGVVVLLFLMFSYLENSSVPFLENLLNLTYPVADFLLLAGAFTVILFIKHWELEKTWWYLSAGLLALSAADLIFSHLTWTSSYRSGHLVDLLWILGYLFIGLAGFYQASLPEELRDKGFAGPLFPRRSR